ncbi:MAG: IS1634 family transposase [Nitrospirae bacterium]|nr:IS1634 family transposase [Magnetococcales bacterium]
MYISKIPNRTSPPTYLLRESYRDGGKVKTRTLTNITNWPEAKRESLRQVLANKRMVPIDQSLTVERSLPHGHVAAVLGTLRKIGLDRVLGILPAREMALIQAMIVNRVLSPGSKLNVARDLNAETAAHSLGIVLDLGNVDEDELYAALDSLLEGQPGIEKALSRRHLKDGDLVLYDLTSTYFEGKKCPIAKRGYSRDGKKDKLQIVFGLLCNSEGCPVAVEVFEGNTADPTTLATQIEKIANRFNLNRIILVGDRGMITSARITQDLKPAGLDWITALKSTEIQSLVANDRFQPSLFDERRLAEITSPDYPGERLVVCRNPDLAVLRKKKRLELLAVTEQKLEKIQEATQRTRARLNGRDKIALKVGAVIGKYKMAKHFEVTITDDNLSWQRKEDAITKEGLLDGFYVIRTSVETEVIATNAVVNIYKSLSGVERAFRSIKTVDLKVRPIFHHLTKRVKAHVFLCMLAYYVEWHMRPALAPLLFDDNDKTAAKASRPDPVAPSTRSKEALDKAARKQTETGFPVQSFRSLLTNLATVCYNTVRMGADTTLTFPVITKETSLQSKAFRLLGINPGAIM